MKCMAPWINISTDVDGSVRPCCRYEQPKLQTDYPMPNMIRDGLMDAWHGEKMTNLRQAMEAGLHIPECRWCYEEEKAGVPSFRQRYQKLWDRGLKDIENPDSAPLMYDLKLSNVCNLKCRICGPRASSLYLKEEKLAGEQFLDEEVWLSSKILGTEDEDTFISWLPHMQELELTGGEPFFSPENKALLERIVSEGEAHHISVLITTNGMFADPRMLDTLSRFRKVHFSLSVDDVGRRLEYQRKGAKFDVIEKNIKRLLATDWHFTARIYRTVNVYNIMYLDRLEEWADHIGIGVVDGMLHDPKHLSIRNLPDYVKDEVRQLDFIKLPSEYNDPYRWIKEFRARTTLQDLRRNEMFVQTHPELAELLMYED